MNFLKAIIIFFLPLALSAQNYYGGIPALFDDFSYSNTEFPIEGDSSNSLYGKNIWLTENGTISSRAWHRYNWGDQIQFGKNSSIEPSEKGISLKVLKGFRFGDIPPCLNSGFTFKTGTYVSRLRFSSLSPASRSILAFWLFSPDHYRFKSGNDSITYMSEVDFEWNNWFMGRDEERLNASIIWAYHTKNPMDYSEVGEINFFKKHNGGFVLLDTDLNSQKYYIENKWYYYLIRLDSMRQTQEFLVESADQDPASEKIYGGGQLLKGKIIPVTYRRNFPRTDLITFYNCGPGRWDNDSILQDNMQIDVDWFYYSPRTDIEISDAAHEVEIFKKQNIRRLNTTGRPTFHDSTVHLEPPTVTIEGPDEMLSLQYATWIVHPSLKNTTYDVEYSYRRLTASGSSDWFSVDKPEAVTYARAADTAIEFTTTVKDWRGMTASTSKLVKVHSFKNTDNSKVFPNPTAGLVVIKLPSAFEKKEYRVEIYTIEGKKLQEYSTNEAQSATVELRAQPPGQYMIVLSADGDLFRSTVTVVR